MFSTQDGQYQTNSRQILYQVGEMKCVDLPCDIYIVFSLKAPFNNRCDKCGRKRYPL